MIMNESALSDTMLAAKLFRGFADPTRLAVLLALKDEEQRVTDIVRRVGTSQPNVSAHLACLKECELVTDRPVGRQVYYRIASREVLELLMAAERLLAQTGHAIDLCGNYADRDSPPARGGAQIISKQPAI